MTVPEAASDHERTSNKSHWIALLWSSSILLNLVMVSTKSVAEKFDFGLLAKISFSRMAM